MELTESSRIEHSPDVLFKEINGESVLLDLGKEQYFGLNEVGTRVWAMLGSEHKFGEILDQLSNEYDVTREALLSDVSSVLDALHEEGLVKIS
jgi:hypothetical protein